LVEMRVRPVTIGVTARNGRNGLDAGYRILDTGPSGTVRTATMDMVRGVKKLVSLVVLLCINGMDAQTRQQLF